MFQKILIAFGIIGVSLSLILGFFSVITWEVAGVLVAVSLGIPALIFPHKKGKSEAILKPKSADAQQKETLRNETISVRPSDGFSYEFELSRDDHLKGRIKASVPIDIYFLDRINFEKWDKNKGFYPEDCNESTLDSEIDYEVPKRGKWYIAIDNNGRKTATVKVVLY